MVATQTVGNRKKTWAYFVSGLLFAAAAAILWVRGAQAAPSYDPWADSVTSSSAIVLTPNNAVGAPNGTAASLAGAPAVLTLDMGEGEEGTQTLRVHLTSINAQVNLVIDFLDTNQNVIKSESRQLGADVNPSVQNFAYNWASFGKAYRFVRITSTVGAGVNVDAVEALGYIGSTPTQDTDGDGTPDRTEQVNGTDPLVPNAAGGNGGNGGGGTNNPPTPPPSSSTTVTIVNNPPAASNDKDGDGMADDWETANGLNPNDKTDADKDPDHDELSNLTEYRINSDPQKLDTDGDGMPDGWEYKHGLNLNVNDANGDPDGDYLTNLGEYRNNTDPNKADDLRKVFGSTCATGKNNLSPMEWFGIFLLIAAALAAWYMAMRSRKTTTKPKDNTTTSTTTTNKL